MNFRRLRSGLWLVAFLAAATAGAGFAQTGTTGSAGVNPNAPPPPPLPVATGPATQAPGIGAPQAVTVPGTAPTPPATLAPNAVQSAVVPNGRVATPAASPSPLQRGRKGGPGKPTPSPEPSDTPEPPQFSTLDGIWEIEIQPVGHRLANYEHFSVVQKGSTLTGYWEHDPHKTRSPITGSFDGRLIQIVATTDAGSVTFSGYVESFGDMVGLKRLSDKDAGVAFTAQHRKKERSS